MVTIFRTKRLHTNTNIFILSVALLDCFMAVSDFVQGIIYSTSVKFNIHNSNVMDAILFGTAYSAITLSCTHMAIIAVDRYVNITHPFYYILNITKRRVIVLLLTAWMFGLAYCSVSIILYRDGKYHTKCISVHPPFEYFIINALLNLIDYVIICICYFKISCLAFQHKKAANARRLQTENPKNVFKLRNNRAAAMKSVKFFVLLFGTFFVFTFPQILTQGMVFLSCRIPENVVFFMGNLYDVHSAMNRVIYFHFNKDFSDGFKKLLSDISTFGRKRRGDCDRRNN
ncbi:unnamed protein product [Candidula unifasciata]|uniref:G-protein coupled receptors family 1 profile domain-containing protein n=1 Tax=Candidula unifasciata TaxID=100452 RepID=A0A8S4ACH0_9EUPU|nr:unnamed protein product [Candidula unifasciata]